ncbi:hypothetical protein NLI96_g3654 [Meripilus lineatus]|uniref:Uncharacterized protein n=1 Tax=Meripilus lineatus TaxID=2056292 RepID=A0AAD5V8H3_9APHY|nr:hypothetical protein NLI96_g3654 [Physisporinus lineatus]
MSRSTLYFCSCLIISILLEGKSKATSGHVRFVERTQTDTHTPLNDLVPEMRNPGPGSLSTLEGTSVRKASIRPPSSSSGGQGLPEQGYVHPVEPRNPPVPAQLKHGPDMAPTVIEETTTTTRAVTTTRIRFQPTGRNHGSMSEGSSGRGSGLTQLTDVPPSYSSMV